METKVETIETKVKTIDSVFNAIQALWNKNFREYMTPEAKQMFHNDTVSIRKEHQNGNYIAAFKTALEGYDGFNLLTETAEVNKTGWHSFTMRDHFKELYELIADEFVKKKLKLDAVNIENFKAIIDKDKLLVLLGYSNCPFALIQGTQEKTGYKEAYDIKKSDFVKVPFTYRESNIISNITFDNNGNIIKAEPTKHSFQIKDHQDIIEKRLYFANKLLIN